MPPATANTTAAATLSAIAIIEHDVHGDTLLSWQYPDLRLLHDDLEGVVMRRCRPPASSSPTHAHTSSTFSKFHHHWIYSLSATSSPATHGDGIETSAAAPGLVAGDPHLQAYSVVVVAKDFHPEKYAAMLRLFAHTYTTTTTASASDTQGDNHVVALLQEFLSIFAVDRGRGGDKDAPAFNARDYDQRRAMLQVPLQLLLDTLGMEHTMTLWTAMMLKKRILVVSDNALLLQQVVRCIPTLVWHRLPAVFDTLRPLVDFSHKPELEDLAQLSAFVAGSLDTGAKADTSRYDVLIDLGAQQVVLPDSALREDVKITRIHKAIAQTVEEFRIQGAQLVKQLALKTREILLQLEQIRKGAADSEDAGSEAMLTMEQLRSLGQPRDVERLLFNIGVCENVAQV